MKHVVILSSLLSVCCFSAQGEVMRESVCHGSPSDGSLDHGWQLPTSGANFEAYSSVGVAAGRTYVHSKVYGVVTDAYKALETNAPGTRYVYGESGYASGGRFRPHKTHQNGLSVDFFVPVIDIEGKSARLPISVFNKLGYNIEFDRLGRYESYRIDFEALAKHLLAIKDAAKKQGVGIRVVIFDNGLQELLFDTSSGKLARQSITFSVKKPWVRHDEHYHVDLSVPCVE